MNNKICNYIVAIVSICLLAACNTDGINYFKIANIKGETWDWNDAKVFTFLHTDTTHKVDIDAELRINKNYEYSNIWIKYVLIGSSQRDTNQFSIQLADEQFGTWLGNGGGSVMQYSKNFIRSKKLPAGKYTLVVMQNMRVRKISNVLDIGIKVKQGETIF